MAAVGISQSSSFAPDSSKAKTAAASIFSIIDRKSKIDPSDESGETIDDVKGEIQLRHVSFKYPLRPDVQIFRDLSLTIHSGKVLRINVIIQVIIGPKILPSILVFPSFHPLFSLTKQVFSPPPNPLFFFFFFF